MSYGLLIPCCLATFCVFLPLMFYFGAHEQKVRSIVFKGLGTLCLLPPAYAALLAGGGTDIALMAAALTLCMAADVLLETRFLMGVACFGTAHVCLITAFILRGGAAFPYGLLVLAPVAAFVLHRFWPHMERKLRPALVAYACVLCVMGAFGMGKVAQGASGLLTALGALLFIVSDILVGKEILTPQSRIFQAVAMALYYAAVALLSASCL